MGERLVPSPWWSAPWIDYESDVVKQGMPPFVGRPSVPSDMVALRNATRMMGVNLSPELEYRQSKVKVKSELPQWSPRSGRTAEYQKWQAACKLALESYGIFDVNIEPPTWGELYARCPDLEHRSPQTSEEHEELRRFLAVMAYWHETNNIVFELVQPSLVLDGLHLESDIRKINTFSSFDVGMSQVAKDGRRLLQWAESFASVATVKAQTDLIKTLDVSLSPNSNLSQLEEHCQRMFNSWQLIQGNEPNKRSCLNMFYMKLLGSLPTSPDGNPIVSVRKWLADKYSEHSSLLDDADNTLAAIVSQAELYGIPTLGQSTEARLLAVFTHNNCGFCDSHLCESRAKGDPAKGFLNCVCHKDSTVNVDVLKATKSAKEFTKAVRAWHEANPTATTLKGITPRSGPLTGADGRVMPILNVDAAPGSLSTCGLRSMFRDECASEEAFQSLLADFNAAGPGLFMLGNVSASASEVSRVNESPVNAWRHRSAFATRGATQSSPKPSPALGAAGGGDKECQQLILKPALSPIKSIVTTYGTALKEGLDHIELSSIAGGIAAVLLVYPRLKPLIRWITAKIVLWLRANVSRFSDQCKMCIKMVIQALVKPLVHHT